MRFFHYEPRSARRAALLLRRLIGVAIAIGLIAPVLSAGAELGAGAAGTLRLGDDGGGGRSLSLSSARPGERSTGCVAVTSDGSSRARVRLYARVSGSLARYLRLTVTRGTDRSPSFPSCASFSADRTDYIGAGPGVIYAGRLSGYPRSEAAGLLDPATGADHSWDGGTSHSYRFSLSLVDDNRAQGLSARSTFMWQARTP